jgi:nucleoside-diphosphate-sugar epimerase
VSEKLATVIGGKGFIGGALVSRLREAGWSCWVPDRGVSWPVFNRPLGRVYYCAGLTADYLSRPADTIEAHVCLLARVLQSDSFESLVYLSSTRIYDGIAAGAVADETAFFPVAPHVPRHLYDLTKLTGECLCHALGRGRARIARLSCVYGGHEDKDGFLPSLLRRVAQTPRGETIQLGSSPYFARDYVHVWDVVRALMDIVADPVEATYNVACGENISNEELAQLITDRSGRRIQFEMDQRSPPPVEIDMTRFRKNFGWCPAPVQERVGPWLSAL